MFSRTVLTFLLVAAIAGGQTRERGKFSLQGEPATLVGIDVPGKNMLIAFGGGTICVFSAEQKIVSLYTFSIHKKAVTGAGFLPDGKKFITCSLDGTLRLWDTEEARKHHKTMEDSKGDGKPEVPKPLLSVSAHSGYGVNCLSISPDGKQVATGAVDGTIKIWDTANLKQVVSLAAAHTGGVKAVQYSPDGKVLASGDTDKTAKLWDATQEKPTLLHKTDAHVGPVNAVAFSADGKQLATGSGVAKKSGLVQVWDVATAKLAYKLEGHEDVVTAVLFHPKTEHLASGCADKKIRVWNLKDKMVEYTDEHAEPIRNLVITTDGTRFGSCSDKLVRWWAGFGK